MFNAEFFPSTPALIERMLAPWLATPRDPQGRRPGYHQAALLDMTIFDPSAGSGKILDWIAEHLRRTHDGHWTSYSKNLYAGELDPELKAMLQGKNYKVITDDFLDYGGDHQFDLIVMNPPFSQAAQHIVHAFKIVAPGGHVVSLLNAETIRNPYSQTRQLLAKLIADHGVVEEVGQPFLAEDAERKTDAHIALVRLQRPADPDGFTFDFHQGQRRASGPVLTEDTFKDAVAVKDIIGNMILGYEEAKKAFVDYMRAKRALEFYGVGLLTQPRDILDVAKEAVASSRNQRGQYNAFADSLNQGAWREVMGKLNIQKYLTHQVEQDFERYGRSQGFMEFSKENVIRLVELVMENRGAILERAVTAVFDMFTAYYKENRCHVEGWKTNDRYKANRKLILPDWVTWNDWSTARDLKQYGSCFRLSSYARDGYRDIDKVMCYLSGQDYDTCHTIEQALKTRFDQLGKVYPGGATFNNECESQFFRLTFFKKGTLHLIFKSEYLWQEFNMRACAGKQWLPDAERQAYEQRRRGPAATASAVPPATPQLAGPGQQLTWLDEAA